VDGDGLLTPPPLPLLLPFLVFMLLIVEDIVFLAACLARSVDTKLLTRSLRFPFISVEPESSWSKLAPDAEPLLDDVLDGNVADFEMRLVVACLCCCCTGDGDGGPYADCARAICSCKRVVELV
jgi:hypothetical protein